MVNLKSTLVISFMGVDGSGKSTLIKKLNERLKKSSLKIKNLHLRPYFFLTDTSTVNSNPHDQKPPSSQLISLIKILKWFFIYHIFFIMNLNKKNQLIIFDRYAHDLLIDRIRYRHSLSLKLTRKILDYFPEPDLWVFLKAPINILEKRKRELPRKELKSQGKKYIEFAKTRNNVLLLNTRKSINSNVSLIEKRINSINI